MDEGPCYAHPMGVVLAASSLVPALLLVWFFHSRDHNPEPARVLWATFGLGVLSTIPAVLLAYPADRAVSTVAQPYLSGLLNAFFAAAIPEELCKGLVVLRYSARQRAFDEPMDGVVYGAVASLGFAALENLLYVADGGLGLAIVRAVTAVPGHAFFGAILGYHVGQAWLHPGRRRGLVARGLGLAMLAHGLYDFPLLTMQRLGDAAAPGEGLPLLALTLAVLVVCWRGTLRLVRRLRAEQIAAGIAAQRPLLPWSAPGSLPDGRPPARPGRLGILVRIVAGALLATLGALATLGGVAMILDGEAKDDAATTALSFGLCGALLLGGLLLFRSGLRRARGA